MKSTDMETDQIPDGSGLWQLLSEIKSEYGLVAFVLIAIIGFGGLVFWKLIWKVWDQALKAKEAEICRLAEERDSYRELVFERLRGSTAPRLAGRSRVPAESDEGNDT